VQLETEVAADNADIGSLAYMTNAVMRGYLKSNPRVATNDRMIWGDDNSLNGYGTVVSNQVPGDLSQGGVTDGCALIFGNWADLIIGLWGGMDVLVNPYANDLAGAVRIVVLQDVDVAVRRAESWAYKVCARA
jgi:hypothetical protein